VSDASLPDGFRDTEIGSLPVDWQVVRLGHVAKFANGYAFKLSQWADSWPAIHEETV